MESNPMRTVLLIAIASLIGCGASENITPKKRAYSVAETKDQPLINQCLIQVVVPGGTSFDAIKNMHSEVKTDNARAGRRLFINYHNGRYDSANLIATDDGDGTVISLAD